jgi:hypothetical protein
VLADRDSDDDDVRAAPRRPQAGGGGGGGGAGGPSKAPSSDKLERVKSQVSEVVTVMHGNLDKVLSRGERLEELQEKTGAAPARHAHVCVPAFAEPSRSML